MRLLKNWDLQLLTKPYHGSKQVVSFSCTYYISWYVNELSLKHSPSGVLESIY